MGQWEERKTYSIYYINKNLIATKVKYTIIEKEFLVVIHVINIFSHYIIGYQTFVHINHSPILFLMSNPIDNSRVTRSLLLLQEFDITIVDKPKKDNVVAVFLSRMTNVIDDMDIEDSFQDEHIFSKSTYSPLYANIYKFLATGKLPCHLSPREKRKNVQQYLVPVVDGYLFQTIFDQKIRRCVRMRFMIFQRLFMMGLVDEILLIGEYAIRFFTTTILSYNLTSI